MFLIYEFELKNTILISYSQVLILKTRIKRENLGVTLNTL